jgi:hypothetical protein
MHKIPVGEGEGMGLIFVIGIIVPILIALPEARWFFALSLPIAAVMAIIRHLTDRG